MKSRRVLMFTLSVVLALFAACGFWMHRERQQYALNRHLIDVLENGDTATALALVNAGADPDTREDPDPSPTLRLLLDQLLYHKRLPINNTPTALIMACGDKWHTLNGVVQIQQHVPEDIRLLQAMLRHGANAQGQTTSKWTALHSAALDGRLHTVKLLLQHGAKVNVQDRYGYTPLMKATVRANVDIEHLLLQQGANPNAQNVFGRTVLHYAILAMNAKNCVLELLTHGADPNLPDNLGLTPLLLAQTLEQPDLVRLLKQHGAK